LRLTGAMHRLTLRSYTTEVETCEHDGGTLGRLTVWASTWYGALVNLRLWDDGTIWVGVSLRPAENNNEYSNDFFGGLYGNCGLGVGYCCHSQCQGHY